MCSKCVKSFLAGIVLAILIKIVCQFLIKLSYSSTIVCVSEIVRGGRLINERWNLFAKYQIEILCLFNEKPSKLVSLISLFL